MVNDTLPAIKKIMRRLTDFECSRCRRKWLIEAAPWNHPGWYCPHCGFYHWGQSNG